MKIENSFGNLKIKWTILKNLNVDVKHVGLVFTTCCVLHNFCRMNHVCVVLVLLEYKISIQIIM